MAAEGVVELVLIQYFQQQLLGWPGGRAFAFRLTAPLRFRLPGAGCRAAEEVDKNGEDPVPDVVEGVASSNLILVLPQSVVTAMVAWLPIS